MKLTNLVSHRCALVLSWVLCMYACLSVQPEMYRRIDSQDPLLKSYSKRLINEGVTSEEAYQVHSGHVT